MAKESEDDAPIIESAKVFTNEVARKETLKVDKETVLAELTNIREQSGTSSEKAEKFAHYLRNSGATDVIVVSCDVCEDQLWLDRRKIFSQLIRQHDPQAEIDRIIEKMDEATPPEAQTRVQAQITEGYLTFCFHCDCTMCMNEIEYPDNPQWDKIHHNEAISIIKQHPEWCATAFRTGGCTRTRIMIDLLVPAGYKSEFISFKYQNYDVDINTTPKDDQIFSIEPGILETYEDIPTVI